MSPTVDEVDLNAYLTLPRMGIEDAMTLGDALIDTAPEAQTKQMEAALGLVRLTIISIVAEMVKRLRKGGYTSDDIKFDLFVDGLWALLRDRLSSWSRYRHAGSKVLLDDSKYELDYAEIEARVDQANKLLEQLFAGGLDFTRTAYIKQSRLTSNLLELIEEDDLGAQLDALAGPELLPTLRACQRHYDAMVKRRLSHDDKGANLRKLKNKLGRHIQLYISAVISTLSEDDPETPARVQAALLPVVRLRENRDALLRGRGVEVLIEKFSDAGPEAEAPSDEAEAAP